MDFSTAFTAINTALTNTTTGLAPVVNSAAPLIGLSGVLGFGLYVLGRFVPFAR